MNFDFNLSENKYHTIYNLDVAYDIVRKQFFTMDIKQQCQRSGADYTPDTITLKYFNGNYKIDVSTVEVSPIETSQPISLREQILILHYFTQAQGTPLSGNQITYRDLPGGLVYYPTFIKRTIKPLIELFGKNPDSLMSAGKPLSSRSGYIGDISLIIDVFSHVPVTVVLWQGDDELSAEMNLLFDATITDYLTSEDVTIVCENVTRRLINYTGKM